MTSKEIEDVFESIKKQQEILEILKPYIKVNEDGVLTIKLIDKEKCDKLKEWLDNDK